MSWKHVFYTFHIETNRLKRNYFPEKFSPDYVTTTAVGASTKATNWRFLEIQPVAKSEPKQLES